jgi:hypothetical protein
MPQSDTKPFAFSRASVLDPDEGAQRHDRALCVARFQFADVLDPKAIARIGLDVDLPIAVEVTDVVDVCGAKIDWWISSSETYLDSDTCLSSAP